MRGKYVFKFAFLTVCHPFSMYMVIRALFFLSAQTEFYFMSVLLTVFCILKLFSTT